MGGSASKSTPKSTAIQNSVMDSSSGLHLFEVHTPTLGAGLGIILIIALAIHLICKRKKRKNSQNHREPPMELLPHSMAQQHMISPFMQQTLPMYWPPARSIRSWPPEPQLPDDPVLHTRPISRARIECLEEQSPEIPSNKKTLKK